MILAIDPGTTQSAWLLWNGRRIVQHAIEANRWLLARLRRGELAGDLLAIEMIASYGMAVGASVFETCTWIGKFEEAWGDRPTRRVFRSEVKLELCGSPRAKDPNVRQALLDRVGVQGKKNAPGPTFGITADEWSALAVAIVASMPRPAPVPKVGRRKAGAAQTELAIEEVDC